MFSRDLSSPMPRNPLIQCILSWFYILTLYLYRCMKKNTQITGWFFDKENSPWLGRASKPRFLNFSVHEKDLESRLKHRFWASTPELLTPQAWERLRFHRFPGDANAAGLGTTLCQHCLRVYEKASLELCLWKHTLEHIFVQLFKIFKINTISKGFV